MRAGQREIKNTQRWDLLGSSQAGELCDPHCPLDQQPGAGEKRPPPARPDGRTCSSEAASLGPQEGCGQETEVKGDAGERKELGERRERKGGDEERTGRRISLT